MATERRHLDKRNTTEYYKRSHKVQVCVAVLILPDLGKIIIKDIKM